MRLGVAILTGILLYILIFIEISITKIGLGFNDFSVYVIHYFALILFVMLCSFLYFRKSRGGAGQGLLLGLVYLITGIILDSLITVPFFIKLQYESMKEAFAVFFSNPYLLIGFLELLVLTILFGLVFKREQEIKRKEERPAPQIKERRFKVAPSAPRTLSELKTEITKPKVYEGVAEVMPLPSDIKKLKSKPKKRSKKKRGGKGRAVRKKGKKEYKEVRKGKGI